MRNDFERHVAWKAYCEMMQLLEWGVPPRQSEADLPQADDIRITDLAAAMRAAGSDVELAPMSFGFPAATPRGGPVFNFRSEGRSFAKSNRRLIPASGFRFELILQRLEFGFRSLWRWRRRGQFHRRAQHRKHYEIARERSC